MALLKLEKRTWGDFCKGMTKDLTGKRAEIEVASIDFGVQRESRSAPLVAVVYDRKSDILEVILDGLDHIIIRPMELYVGYGAAGIENFAILNSDGAWQIVLLHDPLMLPSPRASARGRDTVPR